MAVKKRKIKKEDWNKVQTFVVEELKRRSKDKFRIDHESIWKEVDRQVAMKPVEAARNDRNDDADWHNQIELGELARATEILSADVRRLAFPTNRMWMEAHSELTQLDPQTGEKTSDPRVQKDIDGALRAFMTQQHTDFGLKARVDLSVKEAFHHGSYVVEVVEDNQLKFHTGGGVQSLHAPTWKPHSMWNCFPDPSPSVLGSNMIYNGSMIIRDYIPLHQLKKGAQGDGWLKANLNKIPKRKNKNKDVETEDIELVTYFGDLVIKRQDGDIFLPNSKVINANGIIIFWSENSLPFPPIIYGGYERLDVRDPYFTSPIIKLSPMQTMASQLANRYLDGVDLKNEPPIMYDANDPTFIKNGGPLIAPQAKTGTKGSAKYEVIDVGDPQTALQGLQAVILQMSQGTGIDPVRSGGGAQVEKTKAEVVQTGQRGEVRVVDFVDKLEFSMKSFLYMQHELNKKNLDKYPFYNPEMDAPDFMWASKKSLPDNVHFEIVGAKGVLGEEQRTQKTMAVTAFASQNELFVPHIKPLELLKEAYQDAGNKNPERFLEIPDDGEDQKVKALMEQVQQKVQELTQQHEQEIHELEKKLDIQKAVNGERVAEAEAKAEIQGEISAFKAEQEAAIKQYKTEKDAELALFKAEVNAVVKSGEEDHQREIKQLEAKINEKPKEVKITRG